MGRGRRRGAAVEDECFDVVLSLLGVMFAPRHQIATDELVRVLRPGGRMVLLNWAADGAMGRTFNTVAPYLPPPPPFAAPPALWGDEDHVRGLFDGSGLDLRFERGTHTLPGFTSPEDDVEFHSTTFGPLVRARALAEADGRWPQLHAELVAQTVNSAEYLVTVGHKT